MGKCDRHGYYDDELDHVGVGCGKCAQEDDERFRAQDFHDQTHCQACGEPLPEKDHGEEHFWLRTAIIAQSGEIDYWEDANVEWGICPACYAKVNALLAQIKKERVK